MASPTLERVLAKLEHVERSGKGWTARCPAHDDRQNGLSIGEGDDGRVLLKCFAGCATKDIVGALGLDMRDLFPSGNRGGQQGQRRQRCKSSITLEALAKDKALPIDFLKSLGLRDLPDGGVGIPYYDEAGQEVQVKRRTALKANEGSYWPKKTPLMVYGWEDLEAARQAGYLILVEGESDRWTLKFHSYPVLGIPGADAAKTFQTEHVKGIPKL